MTAGPPTHCATCNEAAEVAQLVLDTSTLADSPARIARDDVMERATLGARTLRATVKHWPGWFAGLGNVSASGVPLTWPDPAHATWWAVAANATWAADELRERRQREEAAMLLFDQSRAVTRPRSWPSAPMACGSCGASTASATDLRRAGSPSARTPRLSTTGTVSAPPWFSLSSARTALRWSSRSARRAPSSPGQRRRTGAATVRVRRRDHVRRVRRSVRARLPRRPSRAGMPLRRRVRHLQGG